LAVLESSLRTIADSAADVKRVTDEAHFTDDLGADWLDRLELMIEIEAQFPTVEFTDDDVDQIDVVGDLIRHLKSARVAKGDDAAVASREPTIGLSTCSTRSLVQWQNHFSARFPALTNFHLA